MVTRSLFARATLEDDGDDNCGVDGPMMKLNIQTRKIIDLTNGVIKLKNQYDRSNSPPNRKKIER